MSSGRHEAPGTGSRSRPDVLSETTDLDTLFEAIVGKPIAPEEAVEPARRTIGPAPTEEAPRATPPVPQPPAPIAEAAGEFEWPPKEPVASTPAPAIAVQQVEPETVENDFEDADDTDDELPSGPTVHRLKLVRVSPWPIMVIVGGMALVTVSAIGLRSGSSPAAPPVVAPPPATLPDGYAPQLPAAPLSNSETVAPPSIAIGDSALKPTGPAARGATATSAAPPTVTPPAAPAVTPPAAPAAAKPAPPPAAKPVATSPAPVAFAPPPAAAEPPAATPPPSARVEEPAAGRGKEEVRLIEPPAPPPAPVTAAPAPIAAPPAVSSARPATTTPAAGAPAAEIPAPVAPRVGAPLVAARRLTGAMPEYSSALRQQKVGGVVEVQIRIDLNGRVVSAIAVSGPPPLRKLAEVAVLRWRYAPATRNGIPIETESRVTFSFDPSQSRRP